MTRNDLRTFRYGTTVFEYPCGLKHVRRLLNVGRLYTIIVVRAATVDSDPAVWDLSQNGLWIISSELNGGDSRTELARILSGDSFAELPTAEAVTAYQVACRSSDDHFLKLIEDTRNESGRDPNRISIRSSDIQPAPAGTG